MVNGSAKAWCNFNVSSGTPVVRNSLNVSSITDNGGGWSIPQFTSHFSAANHATTGSAGKAGGSHSESNSGYVNLSEHSGSSAGSQTIFTANLAGSLQDKDHVAFSTHGDLA